MRKILLLLCLFISVTSQAQVLVIQADFFKQRFYDEKKQDFPEEWNLREECNDTITINLSDSTVKISNDTKDIFRLIEFTREGNGIDVRDGDIYSSLQFVAVDQDDIMVVLAMQFFRSKTLILTVRYGNVEVRYQGKPPRTKQSDIQMI
jgi:hypothetical protein